MSLCLQVQLFPSTIMSFTGNSAQRHGGAIGVDNVRVEEDLSPVLNYNCFLQYNAGKEDEFYPCRWRVSLHARMCVYSCLVYADYRLTYCLIITEHSRGDISCMLKTLVGVHPLLVVPKDQMPLFMKVHCLTFQMCLIIHALMMLPGMCYLLLIIALSCICFIIVILSQLHSNC